MTVSFLGSGKPDILGPDSYEDHHPAVPGSRLDSVYGDNHLPAQELDFLIAPVQRQGASSCHPTQSFPPLFLWSRLSGVLTGASHHMELDKLWQEPCSDPGGSSSLWGWGWGLGVVG